MRRWPLVALAIALGCIPAACIREERTHKDAARCADAPLAAGAVVERELASGELHTYRIDLEAGHYLHGIVTQHGIDVAVTLFDPAGESLLAVDGPNGPTGPEAVAVVAAATGIHRLEIRAPDGVDPGRYELRVEALGPPAEEDRAHAAAIGLYARAELLRRRQDADSRERALAVYRQVLALLEIADDPLLKARTVRRIGQVLYDLGEIEDAVGHFESALALYGPHGNGWELTSLLNKAGSAYRLVGEPEKAMTLFEKAIELSQPLGNRLGTATALNNIGVLHDSLGEIREALRFYDRAVAVWQQLGSRQQEGTTLHNLGVCYLSLGRTEAALDFLERALAIRRSAASLSGQAVSLTAIGWARFLEGDLQAALDAYDEAIALRRSVGDRHGEAVTLDLRGTAYRERGAADLALASYRQALQILENTGNRLNQAHTLTHVGQLYHARSESETALEYHRRALELFRQVGDLNGEASVLVGIAQAERQRGDLATARIRLEEALAIVESVRSRLRSGTFRSSYLATRYDDYGTYVDLLMELEIAEPGRDYAAGALEASERARARSLLESLAEARAGLRKRAAPELLARERTLRAKINAREDLHVRLLSEGSAQEQARHEIIVLPSASVLAMLRRSRAVRPAAPELLAVVADPVFHPDDPRLTRRGGPGSGAEQGSLQAADLEQFRDFGIDRFDRLPYSGEEAAAIFALVPAIRSFRAVGLEASRETVLSGELGRYRIIHFATHGLVNARHPALSGIVLSLVDEVGEPRDGFLRVHEILDLDLPADLVVLSACRTALGKQVRGEGLVGLTRGFFYAGAARVVVSIWNVSDKATSELMARFYRSMLQGGRRPAEALRSAQLSMLAEERWKAPYYWAGFVLQGEWR